ncbi:hypothetical protein P8452_25549 [Trifolium repens]|nr:hypothetical protein P8452_25549 [Trifolium repens]
MTLSYEGLSENLFVAFFLFALASPKPSHSCYTVHAMDMSDAVIVKSTREKRKEGTLAIANFSLDQDTNKDDTLSLVNIKFEQAQLKDESVHTGSSNFDQRRSRFDLAHESWELRRRILNFIRIDPSHTEDMLSEAVMSCLMDWDIDRKLFSMILDSCSTCDNIAIRIGDRLMQNRNVAIVTLFLSERE